MNWYAQKNDFSIHPDLRDSDGVSGQLKNPLPHNGKKIHALRYDHKEP